MKNVRSGRTINCLECKENATISEINQRVRNEGLDYALGSQELKLGSRLIGDGLLTTLGILLRLPPAARKPTLAEGLVAPVVNDRRELREGQLRMSKLGSCWKLVGLW